MYARQDMFEVMICERPYFDLGQRLIRKASSAWHSKGQKTNVLGAFETCRVFATRPRMCLCVCHACQFAFCSASSLPPSSRALSPFLPSLPPPSVWIDLFLSREGARRPIHTTPAQSPHKNGRRERERERERGRNSLEVQGNNVYRLGPGNGGDFCRLLFSYTQICPHFS